MSDAALTRWRKIILGEVGKAPTYAELAQALADIGSPSVGIAKSRGVFPWAPCINYLKFPNQPFYTGTETGVTYQNLYDVSRDGRVIRLMWVNSNFQGASAIPFTIEAFVSFLPTRSTNTESVPKRTITFNNGATTGTVPSGGYLISDPINNPIISGPPDATAAATRYAGSVLIRTYVSTTEASGSNKWPQNKNASSGFEGRRSGRVMTGAIGTSDAISGQAYGPTIVGCGYVAGAAYQFLVAVGDSILDGTGDTPTNDLGFVARACNAATPPVPFFLCSAGGDKASNTGSGLAEIISESATSMLCEFSTNDIGTTSGDSLATVQASLIAQWYKHYMAGKKAFQTTCLPKTISTDQWTTAANQTPYATESVRTALNTWLRAGAPCTVSYGAATPAAIGATGSVACPWLTQVIDTAAVVEVDATNAPTLNGGRWKTGADPGITGTATSATGSTLTNTGASFGALQELAGYAVQITGGTGAGQYRPIFSHTATVLTVTGNWSTTPDATSAYAIRKVRTVDGTHPSTVGHIELAAAVPTSLF